MHLYILKSACLLALLYSGYVLLLSRETLHRFNRAVLLSILLASLLIPALSLTLHGTNPVDEVVQAVYPERTEPVTVIPEKIKVEYRGYNVISKANGRSIFLPFTGGREGDLPPDGRVWNRVEHRGDGGYWTRTLSTMWSAYAYHLTSARPLPFHQEHVFEVFRSKGLSIRPVMMLNKKELKNKP